MDERLGFGDLIRQHLRDPRRGKNTQLPLGDLLRQSVYGRLAGYGDVNDAERLSQDPTFRLIGSEKIWERGAALTSRLQSFETEMLAAEENFAGLARITCELIGRLEAVDSARRVVLDIDSTEIPVYGQQAVKMTRLSCHRFRSDQVRLWLSLIAYNLGNLWRGLPLGSGAAAAGRQLVVKEPATTIGQDQQAADQAPPLLLAVAGRGPSEQPALRGHAAADRDIAPARRVAPGC